MKLRMVYIGTSFSAYGFRLLGSIVRKQFPDCKIQFVMCANIRIFLNIILPPTTYSSSLSEEEADKIAEELSDADILGLSAMSEFAKPTKKIISAVRKRNPKTFIVWGGVHGIMHPEDAIEHADAVCTNEAEEVFPEFLEKFSNGENYKDVGNFWFRDGSDIIKNEFAPLLTSDGLDDLPLPIYGENELIYESGKGFTPITKKHYLAFDALSYNTVWSRGCPFFCSFCGNTRFLEIDKTFGKLRHSSVDHVINEILAAVKQFPHISSIAFHDDCLIALPEDILRSFAKQMRSRVGLPLAIHGVTPAHINRDRIAILLDAGLNRVRMGIQSGSDKLLKFYKRPNRAGLVKEAIDILGEFSDKMMPPTYDMIFDNPIETQEDINDTLRLIYDIPRPFVLNICSLRQIPNTELGRQLAALGAQVEGIENLNDCLKPTYSNVLMLIVTLVKIPRPLFEYLLKFTRPYQESAHIFGPLIVLFQLLNYIKRAYYHFKWLDFSVVFGRLGLGLRRLGFLKSRPSFSPHSSYKLKS